jgi:hypothetical protein
LACFLRIRFEAAQIALVASVSVSFQFRLNTLILISCGKIVDCKKGSRAYPLGDAPRLEECSSTLEFP